MTTLSNEQRSRLKDSELMQVLKNAADRAKSQAKLQPEHVILQLMWDAGVQEAGVEQSLRASADKHTEYFDGSPGTRFSTRLVDLLVAVDAQAKHQPPRLDALFTVLISGTGDYGPKPVDVFIDVRDKLAARRRRDECRLRVQAPLNLPALDHSAQDLLRDAADGRFDRAVEREDEIEQLIAALDTMKHPNALLVGESGVGKAAIVHELARRVAEGEVVADPNELRLFGVSAAALGESAPPGGGTSLLKAVAKDASNARDRKPPIRVVLFVRFLSDLAKHSDAAEELKGVLAHYTLRLVGSTNAQGLKRLQQDAEGLLAQLHLVHVAEPTPERAVKMALANLHRYGTHHGVEIAEAAVDKAVELAVKQKLGRLPRAALDIIDEAASALHLKVTGALKTSAPTSSSLLRVDEALVSSVVAGRTKNL